MAQIVWVRQTSRNDGAKFWRHGVEDCGVRLRAFIIVISALLLTGCESDRNFWRPHHDLADGGRSDNAVASPVNSPMPYDARCRALAEQRYEDGQQFGFSRNVLHAIYQGTLKDCVYWEAQHTH